MVDWRRRVALLPVVAFWGLSPATGHPDKVASSSQPLNIKHHVGRLEKSRPAKPEHLARGSIDFHVLAELEAEYATGKTSLAVATLELGVDCQFSSWMNVHLLALYEESETAPPEFDEAMVTIENPTITRFSVALGRLYAPFGHYDSALIDDPLTLEIGETRGTAIEAGYHWRNLDIVAFGLDGGRRGIFGWAVEYNRDSDVVAHDFGMSWINDLGASNGMRALAAGLEESAGLTPAWAFHARFQRGPLTWIGEYVAATSDVGSGVKPAAWNFELNHDMTLMGREVGFAIARQQSKDSGALELPRSRWLAGISVSPIRRVRAALEYTLDRSEDGKNARLIAQLSVVF